MSRNEGALQETLRDRMGVAASIHRRRDGELMLHTPFSFPDGDGHVVHITEAADGGVRLTDRGHTLMRISYDHDDLDALLDGPIGNHVKTIARREGVGFDGGSFSLDTSAAELADAMFLFGSVLTAVHAVATALIAQDTNASAGNPA